MKTPFRLKRHPRCMLIRCKQGLKAKENKFKTILLNNVLFKSTNKITQSYHESKIFTFENGQIIIINIHKQIVSPKVVHSHYHPIISSRIWLSQEIGLLLICHHEKTLCYLQIIKQLTCDLLIMALEMSGTAIWSFQTHAF